jgi:hypothetical protein
VTEPVKVPEPPPVVAEPPRPRTPISVQEPLASIGFDPEECVSGMYRGLGSEQIGLVVSGFEGELCRFQLGRISVPGQPWKADVARTAAPVRMLLVAPSLKYLEVVAGAGAPVVRDRPLRVRLSAWASTTEPAALPVDAQKAIVKDLAKTITPGKATLGRALDTAVRDMRAGGTRQIELPTDVAGPLLGLLPPSTALFNGDFIVFSVSIARGK